MDSELQPNMATASLLSLCGLLRSEIFESEDGSEPSLQKMVLSEVNQRRLKFWTCQVRRAAFRLLSSGGNVHSDLGSLRFADVHPHAR